MSNIIKLTDTPQGQSRALGKHFEHSNESISNGAVKALVKDKPQEVSGLSVRALDALIEAENALQKISGRSLLAIDKEQALLNTAALANKAIEDIATHLEGVNVGDIKTRRIRYLEAALQDAQTGLEAAEEMANAYQIQVPRTIEASKKTVAYALGENARLAKQVMGGE